MLRGDLCSKMIEQVQEIRWWACQGGDVALGMTESYAKLVASSAQIWFSTAKIFGFSGFPIIGGGDLGDESTKRNAKERMQKFS